MQFIHLSGTFEGIMDRLQKRVGHFMPAKLLRSQFESLEPPMRAITVSIADTPEQIVRDILSQLEQKKP